MDPDLLRNLLMVPRDLWESQQQFIAAAVPLLREYRADLVNHACDATLPKWHEEYNREMAEVDAALALLEAPDPTA